MSKNAGYTGQSYSGLTKEFPFEYISKKKKENPGMLISNIAFGDGKWLIVMSKNIGYKAQYIIGPTEVFPETEIKKQWNQKSTTWDITEIASGNGTWVIVMSSPSLVKESWKANGEFPFDNEKKKTSKNHFIRKVEWMKGAEGALNMDSSSENNER
jgi:hypothetical protein